MYHGCLQKHTYMHTHTHMYARVLNAAMMCAGFDTTTSALSWTLYSLARWPEHQTRVQEEVDAILKDRDSDYILWYVQAYF